MVQNADTISTFNSLITNSPVELPVLFMPPMRMRMLSITTAEWCSLSCLLGNNICLRRKAKFLVNTTSRWNGRPRLRPRRERPTHLAPSSKRGKSPKYLAHHTPQGSLWLQRGCGRVYLWQESELRRRGGGGFTPIRESWRNCAGCICWEDFNFSLCCVSSSDQQTWIRKSVQMLKRLQPFFTSQMIFYWAKALDSSSEDTMWVVLILTLRASRLEEVEEKKMEEDDLREVWPRSLSHHLSEGELDPVLLNKSRSGFIQEVRLMPLFQTIRFGRPLF